MTSLAYLKRKTKGASPRDEWCTPDYLYNSLNREFAFEIDAAATKYNAKCERFFTIENSAFDNEWDKPTFCNPPYSKAGGGIYSWCCRAQIMAEIYAVPVVLVVPGDTSTRYREHAMLFASEIRDLTHRVKFIGAKGSPPFPTSIYIYRPHRGWVAGEARVTLWNYRDSYE